MVAGGRHRQLHTVVAACLAPEKTVAVQMLYLAFCLAGSKPPQRCQRLFVRIGRHHPAVQVDDLAVGVRAGVGIDHMAVGGRKTENPLEQTSFGIRRQCFSVGRQELAAG